jgi:anti-sigma factor RsiW
MKNERDREIMHRMLDQDIAPEEERELKERMEADPSLKEEFDALARMIRKVETSERKAPPAFFTAEVMRRLPARKPGFLKQVSEFLLKGRVLKWNMATAFAGVALAVLVLVLASRHQETLPVQMAAAPQQAQTVTVTMNLYAPEARHVAVAGTFNKWKTDANILTKGENGTWTISIPLNPGTYSYMFVVDGKAWVTDPNAESYRDDGFGYKNAVLRVKT